MSGKNLLAGVSREQLDQEARAVINGGGRNLLDGVDRAEIDRAAREIITRDQTRQQARSQPKPKPKEDAAVGSITGLGNRRPATTSVSDQFERTPVDPSQRDTSREATAPARRAGMAAREQERLVEAGAIVTPKRAGELRQQITALDGEIAAIEAKINSGEIVGQGVGFATEAIARLKGEQADLQTKIESGIDAPVTLGDVGGELINAPIRGGLNTLLSGASGVADYVGFDEVADRARDGRELITEQFAAPASASQNELMRLAGQGGEAIGSTLPFLPAGLGRGAAAGVGVMAFGTGVDQQDARVKAVRAEGGEVSNTQEVVAETFGGLVGLTEMLPVQALLSKVPKGYGGLVMDKLGERLSQQAIGRVGGAMLEEGVQEAAAGVMQDLVELGVYNENVQVGQSALEDFALGAFAGGAIRTGVEVVDSTGRLVRRRRDDTRAPAPGNVERAVEAASTPTQADIDSPLDTGDIVEGKVEIEKAKAEHATEKELGRIGMPNIGTRVTISDPELGAQSGTMRDRFTGPDGSGVVIELDDGKIMREFDDTLADLGISITAEQQTPTGEADALDAQMAAAAQNAISSAGFPPIAEEAPSPVAADPALSQEAAGGGAPIKASGKRGEVAGVLSQAGYSPSVVAGFLGNFEVEGGYEGARGDGGSAAGIAQWRNERRDNFRKQFGKDPDKATAAEQAQFVVWEMKNPGAAGMKPSQRDAILAAKSPEEAARLIDQFYERSDGKARERRAQEARKFAGDMPVAGAAPVAATPEPEAESGGRQRTSMLDRETAAIPEGQRREAETIDRESILAAASQGGELDAEAAGKLVRSRVQEALDAGGTVSLIMEGKSRNIRTSDLVDDKGQRWGLMPILQPAPGDRARLEITYPDADTTSRNGLAPAEGPNLSPDAQATETQAAQVEGGDLPAPQATPPAEQEAAPAPAPANQVEIAPGRTDKSIMLINPSAATIALLKSTVPQAKAGPRDRNGNVSYNKKYEAAIRDAIAQDAASAQQAPDFDGRRPLLDQVEEQIAAGVSDAERRKDIEEYLTDLSDPEIAATPEVNRRAIAALAKLRDAEQTGGDIAGEPISDEWTAFSDDSGTLAIPRAEMPQIKAEHRGAMVNFLNARDIAHSEEEIEAGALKPSQAEFSPSKVEKAKQYEGGNRAILISADNYVVDGHHQWLAARDKGETVRAIRLDAPIRDVLRAALEFPSSETAGGATDTAPTEQNTPGPQDSGATPAVEAPQAGGPDAAADDRAASAGGAVTPIPARTEDASDVAVTATGTEIPVTYAVVEMSDLIASNTPDGGVNPDYPVDRQPRDRTRAASQAQIAEIASRLNPRLLGRSAKASDGAPIISPDGVVESGNGRTLALQRVYAEGSDSAQSYRQFVEGEGFDIAGMEQPVLVRIRDTNLTPEQVQEFVRAANVRDTAGMSGTELAASDASTMSTQMVDLYRGGDIDAAGNRDFVRAFVNELVPTNDRASLILADGSIAKGLVARIEAALLVRAFGERPFIEKMVDATDSNIRAIGKALVEMAGKFAKLREAAQDGRVDGAMDITGNIAEAVEIIDRARREGKPVTDYVNQRDIFSGTTVAQLTEASLHMFFSRPNFTKPHGQARLVSIMDFYVEEAMKAAPGGGLFGESTKATPDGIIDLANERNAQTQTAGADLFAADRQPGDGADGARVPEAGGDRGLAGEGVQAPAGAQGAGGSAAVAEAAPTAQPARIDDFGEKLEGARKDYASRMAKAKEADVVAVPLSQSWPEPDYVKLIESGADPYVVAWVRAARDEIPTKPQKGWKLKGWVDNVQMLREFAEKLLAGDVTADAVRQKLNTEFSRSLRDLQGRVDLYEAIGHERSLKGITLSFHHYSLYRGREDVDLWAVEQKARATAFSNWPKEIATADTKQEAIDKFKAALASGAIDPKAKRAGPRFEIYSYRSKPGKFIIGVKVGRNTVDLKEFGTIKEARDYRISEEGDAWLQAEFAKFKGVPDHRRRENSPRIGVNHRAGADVTPEQFQEAFGFRGVQFGNYVEGARRQEDLNEAYDALMDLAGVIGVPSQALSLNGELGLAFGARGKGGKRAAAAHYEPGTIVINLTKGRGAGSLAHEWWHSLDNYFSRMRSDPAGYVTARPYERGDGVRPEMVQAFKGVMQAIKSTGLRERSKNLDKRRTKEYWSTDVEMSARSFESYVIAKLQDEQFSNDYLANIVSEEAWQIEDGYPYLRAAEIPAVRAAYDAFFDTVETRATDRGLALAERNDGAYDDGRDPAPTLNPASPAAALRRQLDGTVQPAPRAELRALGIAAEIERAGTSALVGREITAPAQLAEIAQIHRDPRYETFRVFFMRGTEVVHASAVTSRLSNEAPLLPGDRNADAQAVMDWMTSTMESSGADGYYLLHNHPTGDPDPSPEDIAVTRNIAAMVPGFRSHVVINSNKFAFITADGGTKVRDLYSPFDPRSQQDALLAPSKPSNILGAKVGRYDELATLAKQAQREGYATVIAADNKFRVRAILDIPNEQLQRSNKYLAGMMRRLQRRSGSAHLFLVGDPNVVFSDKPRKAFEERIITEILSTDGSPISGGVSPRYRESLFSRTARGMAVAEEAEAYDPAPSGRNMPERSQAIILAGSDPTWRGKMETAYNEFRRAAQDRYLPLLRVQRDIELRQGAPLPPEMNPYLGEELMAGRIGARLETLMEDRVRPLFDAMADEKVTTEELESFLYARHAPERNARIAEINPEFTEGTGSGMTDLEARAIMARVTKQGKMEAMQRLSKRVDEIRDETLDRRVEYGLMGKEEADEWRSTYQFYVPLRGFAEGGSDAADVARVNRSGGGINVRGKESKAAFGRRSVADSPLAYLLLQAEEAIVRGETNRVAQRFVDLAQTNPDDTFWTVNKITQKKRANPDTGLVENYIVNQVTAEDRDWTVTAKVDGKERRVTMNRANPSARALADAMRNLTQHQLDFVTKYLGAVNRFLSRVNTSYNPEFLIANAVRDVQTAAFNLTATEQEGLVGETLKNYRAALVASTKGAFGNKSGEWGQWYREFMEDGGRVFFNQTEDVELIKKRIQRIAEQVNAARGAKDVRLQAKRLFGAAVSTIENVNLGVENAIRLAAYRAGRERGMTRENAASLAKNLTVNFNRRGTFGPIANSLYLFFNASVQGTARMLQATRSKRLQKVLAGVALSAAVIEIMNAMVSGDDDDGESYYDKIASYEKRTNLIIMLPNGKDYVKLPLPYGYNVFYGAGRAAAEIARRGGDRWKDSAADLLTTALEAFNPIGFDFEGRSGWEALVTLVTPSMLDPIVDLSQNRNFMGSPILPEKSPYGPPDPEHQRYFGGVGTYWVGLSEILNTATGGDDVREGAVSISPGTFEYLFGTVVGAAGSFVDRVASIPTKAGDPTYDFGARDVPFARKVVGGPDPWYDRGAYYERIGTIEGVIRDTRDYLDREQFDSARSYAEANAMVLSLEPVMKEAQKELRGLRKAKRENEGLYEREQIDEMTFNENRSLIRDREDEIVTAFNTIWNRTVESGREFGAEE